MNIRLLEYRDIPTIIEQEEMIFGESLGEENLKNAITSDLYKYFVLEHEKLIVGYIGLWIVDDFGQVINYFIHPNYQQKGLGSLLFKYSLEEFARCEVKIITLEVRCSNTAAIKVYEKFGFEKTRVRKNYYPNKEDAYVYEKKVR